MATAPEKTTDKPTPSSPSGAESPTTARPLEMDDDDVQDTGIIGGDDSTNKNTTATAPAASAAAADEPAPAKPPRPLTEAQKNEAILKEAFPTVDAGIIKAVLSASAGRIDPAFNALLEMTDPDAVKNEPAREEAPPPRPPRPSAPAQISQLEADELYARQLAEHWENVGAYEQRTSNRGQGGARTRQQQQQQGEQDKEHNFFDDDLPVIQEKLKQGFVETQGKVNSWITTMKKRFDDEFAEQEDDQVRTRPVQGHEQFPGPRPGQASRRSGDYERYDADPQVLSDDFAGMRFNPDGTPVRERGVNSPDMFRPPPPSKSPRSSEGRKVAFRDSAEQIDVYGASPKLGPEDSASKTKSSKWQPLSSVDPNPISDNDPFSLGDSEDERETKDKTGAKEIKLDDNERLKQAAAEAMADSLVDSKTKPGEAAASKKD